MAVVELTTNGSAVAGSLFTASCHVSVEDVVSDFSQSWTTSSGLELDRLDGLSSGDNRTEDSLDLLFDPLELSNGSVYNCIVQVEDSDGNMLNLTEQFTLIVTGNSHHIMLFCS